MQTFLPYPDFARSAAVLDRARLGKQRIEVLQLLKALTGQTTGWSNHPAAKMWRGHLNSLVEYGVAICDEWLRRGYKDTCRAKILEFGSGSGEPPPWLGNPEFHRAHQSNLKRKDSAHYAQFEVPSDLEYVWPVGRSE